MPWNGSGTYNPPAAPNFPAVTGTTIEAAHYNTVVNDLATAITACMPRNGEAAATQNMNMGAKRITNLADPTADTDAVTRAHMWAYVQLQLPLGVIMIWSGSIATIPSGWSLCNGSGGTPDLRNRFVIGAGSTYAVNATGGATTATTSSDGAHTHTASTDSAGTHYHTGSTATHILTIDQIPSHTHTINEGSATPSAGGVLTSGEGVTNLILGQQTTSSVGSGYGHYHGISGDGAHTHTATVASNGAHTHTVSTMSPYFALAFIQKTSHPTS